MTVTVYWMIFGYTVGFKLAHLDVVHPCISTNASSTLTKMITPLKPVNAIQTYLRGKAALIFFNIWTVDQRFYSHHPMYFNNYLHQKRYCFVNHNLLKCMLRFASTVLFFRQHIYFQTFLAMQHPAVFTP